MSSTREVIVACFVAVFGVAIAGQQVPAPGPTGPATPPPSGLILGRVVDAATGTPLSGVLLTLVAAPSPVNGPGAPPGPRAMLTDAHGRFVFRNLAQASYRLTTELGGRGFSPSGFLASGEGHSIAPYLNGGYGQRTPDGPLETLDLADGQRIGDVVVRLWKGGAIEGTVVDEAGEPLVAAVVAAVRRSSGGRLLDGPSTRTDDRGAYRIGTLLPGEYLVVVPQKQVLMPASTVDLALSGQDLTLTSRLVNAGAPTALRGGLRAGETVIVMGFPNPEPSNVFWPREGPDRRFVYQSTFHPSATTPALATPIRLRSGETRAGVMVRLTPVPGASVSGTLVDDVGPVVDFGVHLTPAPQGDGAAALTVASTATDARGRFTFALVPTGAYRLVALRNSAAATAGPGRGAGGPSPGPTSLSGQPGAWAYSTVEVRDEDVTDLTLRLRPPLQVSGRVEFVGGATLPPANRLRQLAVMLLPVDPLSRDLGLRPTFGGRLDADNTFVIRVPAGRYVAGVMQPMVDQMLPGWGLASITHEGRNLVDRAFTLDTSDVADVVVTFTDRPSALKGTVRDGRGAIGTAASVFVFPTDPTGWRDARAAVVRWDPLESTCRHASLSIL